MIVFSPVRATEITSIVFQSLTNTRSSLEQTLSLLRRMQELFLMRNHFGPSSLNHVRCFVSKLLSHICWLWNERSHFHLCYIRLGATLVTHLRLYVNPRLCVCVCVCVRACVCVCSLSCRSSYSLSSYFLNVRKRGTHLWTQASCCRDTELWFFD